MIKARSSNLFVNFINSLVDVIILILIEINILPELTGA